MKLFKLLLIFVLLFLGFSGLALVRAEPGLVAYWNFDEGSGSTAFDSSGNGNTGTLINGPSWVTGIIGNALNFDGVNDYVLVSDSQSLNITGNQFTISAWVYPRIQSQSFGDIINKRPTSSSLTQYYLSWWKSGSLTGFGTGLYNGSNVYFSASRFHPPNNWYYVVASYDGTHLRLWVDGELEIDNPVSGNLRYLNAPVRVGDLWSSWYFNGTVDELKVYNTALTPVQYNITDLKIKEIQPIQVIKGVPLIANKSTMVRVFVEMKNSTGQIGDLMRIDDVELSLRLNVSQWSKPVPVYSLFKTLINYDGKTYVMDKNIADSFIEAANKDNFIMRELDRSGIDAFNFPNVGSPLIIGNISSEAEIDPMNQILETNNSNNILKFNVSIKNVARQYIYGFFRAFKQGGITPTVDEVKEVTKLQSDYLTATYPFPDNGSYAPLYIPLVSPIEIPSKEYKALVKIEKMVNLLHLDVGVGVVDPTFGGNWYGITNTYTSKAVLLTTDVLERRNAAGIAQPSTLAHEFGHVYGDFCEEYEVAGFLDFGECDNTPGIISDWDETNWPYGNLAEDGWDVRRITGSGPKISANRSNTKWVLNNYCFMQNANTKPWIEREHYLVLMDKLVDGGRDPEVMLIGGFIYDDDTVNLTPIYVINSTISEDLGGNYSINLLASNGTIISSVSFEPRFEFFDEEMNKYVSPFVFTLEYTPSVNKLIVNKQGVVLYQSIVSPAGPIASVDSIMPLGENMFSVMFSTLDTDGDVLYKTFSYTSDNGITQYLLLFEENNVSSPIVFNLTGLPGSADGKIKLTVTDGFNIAEVFSPPFAVAFNVPSITINSPVADSVFSDSVEMKLEAVAYDAEDGDLSQSVAWFSNIDGLLGSGSPFYVSNFTIGTHVITATVSDSHGNTQNSFVEITISESNETDVSIDAISFSPASPRIDEQAMISAILSSKINEASANILFYDGDPLFGGILIFDTDMITNPNFDNVISVPYAFSTFGFHNIFVIINSTSLSDINSSNNQANKTISVLPPFMCGDVNNDGVHSVIDVVNMINVAFRGANQTGLAPLWVWDVNGDSVINIIDVVKIINVAFRGANVTTELSCNEPVPYVQASTTINIQKINGGFSASASIDRNVAGMQFDLSYDSSKVKISGVKTATRTSGMTITNTQISSGKNRIAIYSDNGEKFIKSGQGTLFTVQATGNDFSSLKLIPAVVDYKTSNGFSDVKVSYKFKTTTRLLA